MYMYICAEIFTVLFCSQTLGTNDNNAYGYYSVIKEFQWRRVMILYADHDTFEKVRSNLSGLLGHCNYCSLRVISESQ